MSISARQDAGSFRDPSGQVWHLEGRIFRTVKASALQSYKCLRESGLLTKKFKYGRVVETLEVSDEATLGYIDDDFEILLEHSKIRTLSYPYEWCFAQLKQAALFHLELILAALDKDMMLSDATAYNIQFEGTQPCFIDILSFRPYQEGEIWNGYKQFCEQFLNPLLLQSELGVPYNGWYRGSLEGISGSDLAKLLPFHKKFKPKIAAHVVLPSSLQARANKDSFKQMASHERRRKLSLLQLRGIISSLSNWIGKLEADNKKSSAWSDYEHDNTYTDAETAEKAGFLNKVVTQTKPELVWDVGCNTGQFAEICLTAGAKQAVGLDFDIATVSRAAERAKAKNLNFLALHQDLANPSPGQGWFGLERSSLANRCNADLVIALALIHHLVIGRNIPMRSFAEWLTSLAPMGVVEFVPKNDPMVQALLANREDIFPDYTVEHFEQNMREFAEIDESKIITETGRTLFLYQRKAR